MTTQVRLDLDFIKVNIYSKTKCPNFTGIKEHGNRLSLNMSEQTCDKLMKKYDKAGYIAPDYDLNFYEDKTVNITRSCYNYDKEEWYDVIVYTFKGKELDSIQDELDWMFRFHQVKQCGKVIIKCLNDVVDLFKTNQNYIMFD